MSLCMHIGTVFVQSASKPARKITLGLVIFIHDTYILTGSLYFTEYAIRYVEIRLSTRLPHVPSPNIRISASPQGG